MKAAEQIIGQQTVNAAEDPTVKLVKPPHHPPTWESGDMDLRRRRKERFGAKNPTIEYINNLRRILMIIVVTAVGVLGVSLYVGLNVLNEKYSGDILPSSGGAAEDPVEIVDGKPVPASALGPYQVLQFNRRLEEGTFVTQDMIAVVSTPRKDTPQGTYLDADLQSVVGRYTTKMIEPYRPITIADVTSVRPAPTIRIPRGYRAATIKVDRQTALDGLIGPGKRVDVLWLYQDSDGKSKVKTIVPFAKVLTVGGLSDPDHARSQNPKQQQGSATLMVTSEQAKMIELARNTGSLSLALVGHEEIDETPASMVDDPVTERDLKRVGDPSMAEPADGYLVTRSPVSGELRTFVLTGNSWRSDNADTDRKVTSKEPGAPLSVQGVMRGSWADGQRSNAVRARLSRSPNPGS